MQYSSPINTGLLAAILTAVTQIEIGQHASECLVAIANIAAASVLAYLGRRIHNGLQRRKQQPRQRKQKSRPQHMVLPRRRRAQHKASVAKAPNGLGSKQHAKNKKQYA